MIYQYAEIVNIQKSPICRHCQYAEVVNIQKLSMCRNCQVAGIVELQEWPIRRVVKIQSGQSAEWSICRNGQVAGNEVSICRKGQLVWCGQIVGMVLSGKGQIA